jgi:acetyl esterase/lipase
VITRRSLLMAALALPASACSPIRVIDSVIPSDGYRLAEGLAYGPRPGHKLDVYTPRGAAGPRPVVVFFYGGSWQRGWRADYRFVAEAITSRGFVAVLPDYRKYPEVTFPGFIEDAAAAVGWTRANIARHGGDPGGMTLMGHSAGAHIAAMVALDGRYLAQAGTERAAVRGLIGLAGPYDFLPIRSVTLQRIFGGADGIPQTQPITFATAGAPPTLLLHGTDDITVLPRNSERLSARLLEAGAPARLKLYPGMGHVGIVTALARPLRGIAPVLDDVAAFVEDRA